MPTVRVILTLLVLIAVTSIGSALLTARVIAAPPGVPLTAAFGFQGVLQENGAPVTGSRDFVFRLYDAASGGTEVALAIARNGLAVTNGLYATSLNFGAPAWTSGEARWVDVTVNGQPLSPRTPVLAAPQAIFALQAASATTATNAAQLGGVAPSSFARLYGTGEGGNLTVDTGFDVGLQSAAGSTLTTFQDISITNGTLIVPSGTLLRSVQPFRRRRTVLLALAIALGLGAAVLAGRVTAAQPGAPISSAIPFQGVLQENGVPVSGSRDFVFRIYDAEAGGTEVAPAVVRDGLTVTSGLYATSLDFGAPAWTTSEARWIDVTVAGTSLAPRTPVLAAPQALFATQAGNAVTAGSALTATTAGSATTADTATTAAFATSAGSATTATTATSAVTATTAGSATTATTATNALALEGLGALAFARLYGTGEGGNLVKDTAGTSSLADLAPAGVTSFQDITITDGTLLVPSGTLLRCTGTFTLGAGGTLAVAPTATPLAPPQAPDDTLVAGPTVPGIGTAPTVPHADASGTVRSGGTGGRGLGAAAGANLRDPGPSGGASGLPVRLGGGDVASGAAGGGSLVIRCAGAVEIAGLMMAPGEASASNGGGGGGVILIGSGAGITVTATGAIAANGGAGGDGTVLAGPGGGGGGGLVHLVAPAVTVTPGGSVAADGGMGGDVAIVGGSPSRGGGGGGGSCGAGGNGATVPGSGLTGLGGSGEPGCAFTTQVNPAAFW